MDKKQTAVEWLISELQRLPLENRLEKAHLFYHAKQMEKEQIVDAHYQGYRNFVDTTEISEQYYNETYNSKQ